METTVYFNPSCSKCRTVRGILDDKGVGADYVRYLEEAPTRERLVELMGMLGIDDPRAMVRTGERVYGELGLERAGPDELLDAVVAHPVLLERPIVVREGRAVIARPPERVLEIL
ncbi:MAG: arsenate reductase (glutaredoxin) [Acidimicrobiia bacterium]